jgi:hypothetical protein
LQARGKKSKQEEQARRASKKSKQEEQARRASKKSKQEEQVNKPIGEGAKNV